MFRDRCAGLLRRLAQDCAAGLHGGLVIHGVHRGLRRHEVKPDHGHQGKGVQGDEDVIHGVGSGAVGSIHSIVVDSAVVVPIDLFEFFLLNQLVNSYLIWLIRASCNDGFMLCCRMHDSLCERRGVGRQKARFTA